jgi:pyrimidine operon attenuation protein/uracil phosphoribosyltransferase
VSPRESRGPSEHEPAGHELVERRVIADEVAIGRMLRRMASEIVERNSGVSGLALVGIRTGGLYLAQRLQRLLGELARHEGARHEGGAGAGDAAAGDDAPPLGTVDITLYRDDVFQGLPRPQIGATELPFDLEGVTVVLVDDVLYTGRTVRAALDALMDYGRPRAVQLAVLVDRGFRELPIRADYVGVAVETTREESVRVQLCETDGRDRVVVRTRRSS